MSKNDVKKQLSLKKVGIIPYDDYNNRLPQKGNWGVIGTVRQTFSANALRNGWKIIKVYEQENN